MGGVEWLEGDFGANVGLFHIDILSFAVINLLSPASELIFGDFFYFFKKLLDVLAYCRADE